MKSTNRFKNLTMAVLLGLSLGFIISSCSKSGTTATPVVTTSLAAEIDTAQTVIATTSEGTQPGEYVTGSKTALTAAITQAQTVLSSSSSTQAAITNATANLTAAVAAYRANIIIPIAASSLVAYWKFNGNANDSSGNGHNGTVSVGHAYFGAGTPTLTNDRFGNPNMAYHFDLGGNIDVPYSSAFTPQQMTISLWCRLDTSNRTIETTTCTLMSLDRWYGWKFQTQPLLPFFSVVTDSAEYDRDDNSTVSLVPSTINTHTAWYHLAVTYQAGQETFFVNGVQVFQWTNVRGTINPLTTPVDLCIGQDLPTGAYSTVLNSNNYVNWGGYWKGDIDDVMIYNTALSANQITSIYNQQNTP